MDVNEFLSFARDVMNEHGLEKLGLELDRATRRLGACHFLRFKDGTKYPVKITFSRQHVEKTSQKVMLDTLLHEIAHALTPNDQGHGRLWVAKCKEIGLTSPTRCTSLGEESLIKTFHVICPNCGIIGTRKAFRKPSGRCCRGCKTTVSYREIPKNDN